MLHMRADSLGGKEPLCVFGGRIDCIYWKIVV